MILMYLRHRYSFKAPIVLTRAVHCVYIIIYGNINTYKKTSKYYCMAYFIGSDKD